MLKSEKISTNRESTGTNLIYNYITLGHECIVKDIRRGRFLQIHPAKRANHGDTLKMDVAFKAEELYKKQLHEKYHLLQDDD